MPIDDDYIALVKAECIALSEASRELLEEQLEDVHTQGNPAWTEEQVDRRRAELYRKHLDPLGIAIVRT